MSEILDNFHIGIPCKYVEEAIIPKFIWDYVEDEVKCKCRGGEIVRLELIQEYIPHTDSIDSQCMIMFNIDFKTYLGIWEKRLRHEIEGNWVKVRMHKIEG